MEPLDIDQETAKNLLQEGCFFLLLDVPLGTSVGIDFSEYKVADQFKGFKMIPPGLHYIHYNAVNKRDPTDLAARTGFFQFFQPKQVIIRKWDSKDENISDELLDEEEAQRYHENLIGSLDQHLAPYPLKEYQRWVDLSGYISSDVLKVLTPICGRIYSVPELVSTRSLKQAQKSETSCDKKFIPDFQVEPKSKIHFTEFPSLKELLKNMQIPSELTKHSIDRTLKLDAALKRYQIPDDILGELQFAFVTFIVGQVYESFEQWKNILKVLCSSNQAIQKYPSMYLNFVQVFNTQLKEVPEEIFTDIIYCENYIVNVLHDFFHNVSSNNLADKKLKERAKSFKQQVSNIFKWGFDEEPEDECPVVVTLDESSKC